MYDLQSSGTGRYRYAFHLSRNVKKLKRNEIEDFEIRELRIEQGKS